MLLPLAPAASKLLLLAALTSCPPRPPPELDARFKVSALVYSEQYPAAALKSTMSNNPDSTLATDRRALVLGVTSNTTDDNIRVNFRTLTDNQGHECLYVNKVEFTVTYAPTVRVASDIRDISCTYNVTRAHEQQHVKIDVDAINQYMPHIRATLAAYLASLPRNGEGPFPAQESQRREQRLTDMIAKATRPMANALREARRQRQGVIDTPENYKAEAAKCPGDRRAIYERFGEKR